MTTGEFLNHFEAFTKRQDTPEVQWDICRRDCWPDKKISLDQSDWKRIYTAWYLNDEEQQVHCDAPNAHPLRVVDAAARIDLLCKNHREKIISMASTFTPETSLPLVCLPAIELPNDQYFLLDGNHRVTALLSSKYEYPVDLWSLKPPMDRSVLPDLIHWENQTEL